MQKCECCAKEMQGRADQRFCSSTCRQRASRKSKPVVLAKTTVCSLATCDNRYTPKRKGDMFCSPECKQHATTNHRNRRIFSMAHACAEAYYNRMPGEPRIDYILKLLDHALNDNETRMMLTNPQMIKPDLTNKRMFWRKDPSNYKTIPEIVNSFCIRFYGVSSIALLRDRNIEIYEDIDFLEDTRQFDHRGWWKDQDQPVSLTDEQIEEEMKGRPSWLTDYVKVLHAAHRPERLAQVAA